ncbi:MAG: 3'(2'),5'-bisphosphate nucleotidase CysQ [Pseudomonadota bacterium]
MNNMPIILNTSIDQEFIAKLINIARLAGDAIIDIYNAPEKVNIKIKKDQSPLTAADMAAHNVIVEALAKLLPIPIISEEAVLPNFTERKIWQHYWLIDPLDGTKEFIARTGEFTVNIALIQNGVPVLGVVHVPVGDETYIGVSENISNEQKSRAEKYRNGKKIADLKTRSLDARFAAQLSLDVLASARHGSEETAALLQEISLHWPGSLQLLNAGSSLKFCWIAEGRADFYPRLAPTCEWDTAAAQAVLVAAGGAVVDAKNLLPLSCNGNETLLNPSFFAFGDILFEWVSLLKNASVTLSRNLQ